MDGLFQQISNILVNPPSSLAFNLVLLFCITTTLQVFLLQIRQNQYEYKTRMLTGVLLLFFSQVILFVASVFSWQVPTAGHLFLPVLDRTISLFDLIIITWLWSYAQPRRMADISFVLLSALALVFGVFTYLFWANQQPSQAFNISQLDQIWNIVSIATTFYLIAVLAIQKPQNWPIGLYILIIHLIAFILHYTSGIVTSDMASSVHLAQLLTYPCLPLLTQRLLTKGVEPDKSWPLISREDNPPEELPVPQSNQDLLEILSLKNQLDISNRALAEAAALIDNLRKENVKSTSLEPIILPAPQAPPLPKPDSTSIQTFARAISPLISNIRVNAELVKADGVGVLGGLQRDFLNEAIDLADQIATAMDSLAAHPDGGETIAKSFKQTELVTGIDSAMASLNNDIRNKSITMRLDLPENPVHLSISQNVLEQILIHLLQNAIQVTPAEESIGLKVEEKQTSDGDSFLAIQLTDLGGGVALKNQDKILAHKPNGSEPRYRGIGSLNSLHLAKTMVEACGGKIWLGSKAKQTTFFVQIPL